MYGMLTIIILSADASYKVINVKYLKRERGSGLLISIYLITDGFVENSCQLKKTIKSFIVPVTGYLERTKFESVYD